MGGGNKGPRDKEGGRGTAFNRERGGGCWPGAGMVGTQSSRQNSDTLQLHSAPPYSKVPHSYPQQRNNFCTGLLNSDNYQLIHGLYKLDEGFCLNVRIPQSRTQLSPAL